jgi:hypothetical protein
VALLVNFLEQNNEKLTKRGRVKVKVKEFPELFKAEIEKIEKQFSGIFLE